MTVFSSGVRSWEEDCLLRLQHISTLSVTFYFFYIREKRKQQRWVFISTGWWELFILHTDFYVLFQRAQFRALGMRWNLSCKKTPTCLLPVNVSGQTMAGRGPGCGLGVGRGLFSPHAATVCVFNHLNIYLKMIITNSKQTAHFKSLLYSERKVSRGLPSSGSWWGKTVPALHPHSHSSGPTESRVC